MTTPMNPLTDVDNKPIEPVQRGEFTSIDGLMAAYSKSADDLQAYRLRAKDRILLDSLIAFRIKRGLSQKDVAQRMQCTQSRISKFENGLDSTTTIGDLRAYAQAIGQDISLLLVRKQTKLADLVKVHTLMIRKAFDKLLSLAADDHTLKTGTKHLAMEVLFENLKTTLNTFEIQLESGDEKLQLPPVPIRDEFVTASVNGESHEMVFTS